MDFGLRPRCSHSNFLIAGPYPILKTCKIEERKEKETSSHLKINKKQKLLVIFLVANFRHIVKNVLEKKILSQIPCFLGKNLVEKSKFYF